MNKKEIAEAQALIDSVRNGTGELKPCTPAFPEGTAGTSQADGPNENMLEYWLKDYAQFRPNWWPLIEEFLAGRASLRSAAPLDEEAERAKFEEWAKVELTKNAPSHFDVLRREDTLPDRYHYFWGITESAWQTWLAARRASGSPTEGKQ